MKKLKIGIIQQHNTFNIDDNRDRLARSICYLARNGAHIIVMQELHNYLYFCQTEDPNCFEFAEPIPGPTTTFFGELAKQMGVVIVCSIFERRAPGLYHNTAVVLENDGTIAGIYRKMHIPDDPGYYEKYYFAPGDTGFYPIPTSVGNIGVMICWDQWFPEAARIMALNGADILVYPTAIGYDATDCLKEKERQLYSWFYIQRAHAVANALPVVAVNRVGLEEDPSGRTPGICFWGCSIVLGQQGELIEKAKPDEEDCFIAEVNLHRTELVRRMWPFLRDRRIDAYHDLLKIYSKNGKNQPYIMRTNKDS